MVASSGYRQLTSAATALKLPAIMELFLLPVEVRNHNITGKHKTYINFSAKQEYIASPQGDCTARIDQCRPIYI